jgi:hypothetical protein
MSKVRICYKKTEKNPHPLVPSHPPPPLTGAIQRIGKKFGTGKVAVEIG